MSDEVIEPADRPLKLTRVTKPMLHTFLRNEERELEQAKAAVEKRRVELVQIEEQYARLLADRDRVAQRLERADAEFESYRQRRAQLDNSLRNLWWGENATVGDAPEHGYAVAMALDAALAGYPEARKVITDELAVLEQRVVDFEREHLSP